jgi:putative SOS response-associated peptidase YedK
MMAIHERMPVVIPSESFGVWLNPAEHSVEKLSKRLRPFHPDEMTAYPVSTLVNNVKQDSAKCVPPLEVV